MWKNNNKKKKSKKKLRVRRHEQWTRYADDDMEHVLWNVSSTSAYRH